MVLTSSFTSMMLVNLAQKAKLATKFLEMNLILGEMARKKENVAPRTMSMEETSNASSVTRRI